MPEQITKHPDVTLKVLESAGAKCGDGLPQKILTACPAEQFCALPGGEMCIYGIEAIPQMTQIAPAELAAVVCPPADSAKAGLFPEAGLLAALFALGMVFGLALREHR